MKSFLIRSFFAAAIFFALAASTTALAYERYNDGCQACHGAFTDATSLKGSIFPSGDKHEMHRSSSAMNTDCDLCHTSGDGRDPFIGSSNGTANNLGIGCTGCHAAEGLRAHHATSGITGCASCHTSDGMPSPEDLHPRYYGTVDTNADGSCNLEPAANVNENWTIGDFLGLDNDGDGLYDVLDPDCQQRILSLGVLEDLPVSGGTAYAALVPDSGTSRNIVYIRNASTGSKIKDVEFFSTDWLSFQVLILPDVNGSSTPDIGVVGVNMTNGELAVQIRDGLSGAFIKNVFFLGEAWDPLQIFVVPDLDGNPGPEIGLLATNSTTGQIVVSIKDAATNTFVSNVFFLNSNWEPVNAIVIPDFDANPGPEIGLLAANRTTSQIVFMVKDASTNSFIQNSFYLSSDWTPVQAAYVPDAGHAGPVVAVLAQNDTFGKIATMLKDVSNNGFVRNLFHLGADWTPGVVVVFPDFSGAASEIGVGALSASDKPLMQIRDAGANTFLSNVAPLSAQWTIGSVVAVDASPSTPRIGVLAERKSDGIVVIQTIDASSGEILNNTFLN